MTGASRLPSVLVSLLLALQGLSPLLASDLLQRDFRQGRITQEQYILYEIARIRSNPLLPDKYVTEEPLKCATPVWKMLLGSAPVLSLSTRQTLETMKVNFSGTFPTQKRPEGLDKTFDPDTGIFRFHYTTGVTDGVDPFDGDGNGVPDYVDRTADAFMAAYVMAIDSMGMIPPPSDGWLTHNGGNERYDIYIHNLGPNYYGETVPEEPADNYTGDNENSSRKEINAFTSFISIRNNFSNFPKEELYSIQVTAAHEFFHAIQFGYDGWEAIWMLEATATWMEDEVFDHVNDNYQYLKDWLRQPHIALDKESSPHWYGSWIFFRYLSEHLGGVATIRKIFDESVSHNSFKGNFSILTIDRVLSRLGSGFSRALSSMVVANEVLSSHPGAEPYTYEEADDYRRFGVEPAYRKPPIVLSDSVYTIVSENGDLDRNASHYVQLIPASGPIDVSLFPASAHVDFQVKAIIQKTSQSVTVYDIGKYGNITVPNDIRRLTIAVVSDTARDANYGYTMKLEPRVLLPSRITLFQNFPNPFNEMTTFRFFLPEVSPVSLFIFDLRGRKVEELVVTDLREGFNDTRYQARYLPSGVYVIGLHAKGKTHTRKFTVIK